MDGLKEWFGVAALVISVIGSVYAWITAKSKVNAERLDGVDKHIRDHDRRILEIENDLKHLPAKDDVNQLKIGLTKLGGSIDTQAESIAGLRRSVGRIEDFLTKKGEAAK